MRKLWHVVSAVALVCLIVGILGIGVGFFTGSSPTAIQNHGALTEYFQRLQYKILRRCAVDLDLNLRIVNAELIVNIQYQS